MRLMYPRFIGRNILGWSIGLTPYAGLTQIQAISYFAKGQIDDKNLRANVGSPIVRDKGRRTITATAFSNIALFSAI